VQVPSERLDRDEAPLSKQMLLLGIVHGHSGWHGDSAEGNGARLRLGHRSARG
jgi:hypothetical protein